MRPPAQRPAQPVEHEVDDVPLSTLEVRRGVQSPGPTAGPTVRAWTSGNQQSAMMLNRSWAALPAPGDSSRPKSAAIAASAS